MAIHIGLPVGRDKNWGNKIHSSGIHRHQLFPKLFLAGRDFQPKDLYREFSVPIYVERASIRAPSGRRVSGHKAENRAWFSSRKRMYSVDYPFEDVIEAKEWFDQAAISDSDRAKIARGNAQKLFRL